MSRNALGNLANRYRAVLRKCRLLNLLGSLVLAGSCIFCMSQSVIAADVTLTQKNIHFRSDKNNPDGYTKTYDGNLTINGATFNTQNPVTSYTEADGIETSRDNSLKLTDPSSGGFISDETAQQKGRD